LCHWPTEWVCIRLQEYEDLSLKYLEPEVYKDLEQKMSDAEELDGGYLEQFSMSLEDLLRAEGFQFSLKRRTKGIYSIRRKMVNQECPLRKFTTSMPCG